MLQKDPPAFATVMPAPRLCNGGNHPSLLVLLSPHSSLLLPPATPRKGKSMQNVERIAIRQQGDAAVVCESKSHRPSIPPSFPQEHAVDVGAACVHAMPSDTVTATLARDRPVFDHQSLSPSQQAPQDNIRCKMVTLISSDALPTGSRAWG